MKKLDCLLQILIFVPNYIYGKVGFIKLSSQQSRLWLEDQGLLFNSPKLKAGTNATYSRLVSNRRHSLGYWCRIMNVYNGRTVFYAVCIVGTWPTWSLDPCRDCAFTKWLGMIMDPLFFFTGIDHSSEGLPECGICPNNRAPMCLLSCPVLDFVRCKHVCLPDYTRLQTPLRVMTSLYWFC